MQRTKEEVAARKIKLPPPQRLYLSGQGSRAHGERATVSCPFCHKAVARFRLMDSTYQAGGFVRVAYFTCSSCSQDWSIRIDI